MDRPSRSETDVLVVGAGPTGLVMATELAARGVSGRIIDRAPIRSERSRALVVQARSLELLQKMGVADELVARGRRTIKATPFVEGRPAANLEFGDIGVDDTPYPFLLFVSQAETERVLEKHLESLGEGRAASRAAQLRRRRRGGERPAAPRRRSPRDRARPLPRGRRRSLQHSASHPGPLLQGRRLPPGLRAGRHRDRLVGRERPTVLLPIAQGPDSRVPAGRSLDVPTYRHPRRGRAARRWRPDARGGPATSDGVVPFTRQALRPELVGPLPATPPWGRLLSRRTGIRGRRRRAHTLPRRRAGHEHGYPGLLQPGLEADLGYRGTCSGFHPRLLPRGAPSHRAETAPHHRPDVQRRRYTQSPGHRVAELSDATGPPAGDGLGRGRQGVSPRARGGPSRPRWPATPSRWWPPSLIVLPSAGNPASPAALRSSEFDRGRVGRVRHRAARPARGVRGFARAAPDPRPGARSDRGRSPGVRRPVGARLRAVRAEGGWSLPDPARWLRRLPRTGNGPPNDSSLPPENVYLTCPPRDPAKLTKKGASCGCSFNSSFSAGLSVQRGPRRSPDDLLHRGRRSRRGGPRALAGEKGHPGYVAGSAPRLRPRVSWGHPPPLGYGDHG